MPTFQATVERFRSMPAPAVLAGELSVARACLQKCVNDGDMRTAAIWATCINKLSRSHMSAGVLAGELLTKRTVISLVETLLRCINAEFRGQPGFEDRYLRLAQS